MMGNHLMSNSDRIFVIDGWIRFGSVAVIPVEEFAGAFTQAGPDGRNRISIRLKSSAYSIDVFVGTRQECRNRVWWLMRELS